MNARAPHLILVDNIIEWLINTFNAIINKLFKLILSYRQALFMGFHFIKGSLILFLQRIFNLNDLWG